MNRYLLLIKDRNEVHKEETNGMYLHEDAAYNYLVSRYNDINENILATIDLGTKGYIVISISPTYIFIILPCELNEDQKQYLESKRNYLRKNLDKLSIVDLIKKDEIYIPEEYIGEKLYNEFNDLFDKKLKESNKMLIKK